MSLFFYLRREASNYKFQGQVPPVAEYEKFEDFMAYLFFQREVMQTTYANTYLAHIPTRFENSDPDSIFDHEFIHMGLTEKMDASVKLLAAKLNKSCINIPAQNISPRTKEIDSSLRDVHMKLFEKEHAFYRVIEERHTAELKEAGLA